jgi:hypothetical protein
VADLLAYLAPSRARRQLLAMLWREDVAAPIRQLATLCRLPYAATHRELALMEKAGLAAHERRGRALVYRRNDAHPQADLVRRLVGQRTRVGLAPGLDRSPSPWLDAERIKEDLAALGAPILTGGTPRRVESPERAIAAGLQLARLDAHVALSLPLVLARHWRELDPQKLAHFARGAGEGRTLGFLLEITSRLAGSRKIRAQARSMRDRRVRRTTDFFVRTKQSRFGRELAERNTPAEARAWHFRMNLPYEAFAQLFEEFSDL